MVYWIPKLYLSNQSDNYYPKDEFFVAFEHKSLFNHIAYSFFDIVVASIKFTEHCILTLILLLSVTTDPHFDSSYINGIAFNPCVLITTVSFTYRHINAECFNDLCAMLKQSFNVVFFLYSFSHLIHSLLFVISSDTILLLVFLFICLNFIFNNFSQIDNLHVSSQRISFNFGISASLCVASRLYYPLQSFLLILFAVEIYSLFPISNKYFMVKEFANAYTITLGLSFLFSPTQLNAFHIILILFVIWVNLITPLWFYTFQRFKVNFSGKWDEFHFN